MPELGGDKAISQVDGRLAWEIAAEISTVPEILIRYGMAPHEFKAKLRDPMFRQAIREAKNLWKSDLNVQQRVRLKAAFLVEDSLLDIFAIIKSENSIAAAKLEAFEKLMKTADLVPRAKDGGNAPSAFKINIITGAAPSDRVTIDATAIADQSAV